MSAGSPVVVAPAGGSTGPPGRSAAGTERPLLHRYQHRFGGAGTIVTLDDGRAFTAAHCLADVDGARGIVIGAGDACWRVVKRWSPKRTDVAMLQALPSAGGVERARILPHGSGRDGLRLATGTLVTPRAQITFVGHTGLRFQERRAQVIAVTATSATAVAEHPIGVCANDSGGPVFLHGVLVGIVTHRTGPPLSSFCSRHLVFTRLDSPEMRQRIGRAYGRARQPSTSPSNTGPAVDV